MLEEMKSVFHQRSTFNRITRLDLTMHPQRMHIRHELLPGDFDRRMRFARWLINRCQRNEERNVDGENYLRMKNDEIIPQLRQHYPVQARGAFRHLWWLQDGALAHRLFVVQERLRQLFGNYVIALGHNVE